jgi:hypothetical protein
MSCCAECVHRIEKHRQGGKPAQIITNRDNFCTLGFKQNLKTKEATRNCIRNGACLQ